MAPKLRPMVGVAIVAVVSGSPGPALPMGCAERKTPRYGGHCKVLKLPRNALLMHLRYYTLAQIQRNSHRYEPRNVNGALSITTISNHHAIKMLSIPLQIPKKLKYQSTNSHPRKNNLICCGIKLFTQQLCAKHGTR